jgi:hypothetical protein
MQYHTRRLNPTLALFVLASVALSPPAARAQGRSASAARAEARADAEMRQRMLWDLEKLKKDGPARRPVARPDYGEVAEEFRQLQLVNYSLAGAADPKAPLDFARVRKESAEVRKRAARLKGYLSLPEVEEAKAQGKGAEMQTPEALRAAVVRLDQLVNSFAWNPVFQKPDVVDLEQSTKASRDLAGIISLSEQIRKSAEGLGKSLAKK